MGNVLLICLVLTVMSSLFLAFQLLHRSRITDQAVTAENTRRHEDGPSAIRVFLDIRIDDASEMFGSLVSEWNRRDLILIHGMTNELLSDLRSWSAQSVITLSLLIIALLMQFLVVLTSGELPLIVHSLFYASLMFWITAFLSAIILVHRYLFLTRLLRSAAPIRDILFVEST